MENTTQQHSESAGEPGPIPPGAVQAEKDGSPVVTADQAGHPDQPPAPAISPPPATLPHPSGDKPSQHRWRKWLVLAAAVAGLAAGGYFLIPWVVTALNTVSTDDAYVNGHVTFVAPAGGRPGEQGPGG